MDGPKDGLAQQFLVGQRVRVCDEARGEYFPDVGHWIALVEYAPGEGDLYGVTTSWPPTSRQEVQEGFYPSDLTLWAD